MGRRDIGMYKNLVYISQIGIMMITPILGGVVIGKYLSEKMDGNPIVFFLCLILGIFSSFYELYRFSMKYIEDTSKKSNKKRK